MNNRTEQQALIDALSAVVDLVELQAALAQDGYVMKKAVSATVTAASNALAVDFSSTDLAIATVSDDVAVSISGLESGQTSKLSITKGASNDVTFVGVDNYSGGIAYGLTNMTFEISNVNGLIFVKLVNDVLRRFSLVSTDSEITVTSQHSVIQGMQAIINMEINANGSDDVEYQIGELPFKSFINHVDNYTTWNYLSSKDTAIGSNAGSDVAVDTFWKMKGTFADGGHSYYINGVINFNSNS